MRLLKLSRRQMPEIAPKPAPSGPANASSDPLKKPTQLMLALFGSSTIGAPETKPKEAFVWAKTNRDIGHAAVEQILSSQRGIHVNQNRTRSAVCPWLRSVRVSV
jgi:hypothetical protein